MERVGKGWIIGLILLTVAAFFAVAYGEKAGAAEPKPRYGGILKMADQYDGTSIGYPPKLVRVYGNRQAAPAIETLFRTDKTGKPVPWLAAGSKEDAKAKTITLTLRKGVKFHDGTAFNAEAVKWNLSQCMAAKTPGTEKFKSVDVADEYTVRIGLIEWDSTIVSNLAQTPGMMISPAAYNKNGEQWCATHPVGTGPFEFVSWEKDTRTVYKKFPGYWQKGKPYVDGIEWTPILDGLTRQLSLKKGEFDLILSVPPKDVAALEKDGFVVVRNKVGAGATTLVPNSADPKSPFADVRVRRAAQHSIDTDGIVKAIYQGEAEPTNQWTYKDHWGHNPSVAGYPYNPAKAKELLAEAGYPNGFKTKILYRTNPEWDQIFTAVQGYLKAVGIEAELDPAQTGRYDQVALQGGKWEGLMVNANQPNPDVAAPLAQWYTGGGRYFSQMSVPEDYVAAIQKAVSAPDFKTKQARVREAMKLMIDKYALQITLFCRRDFSVNRAGLHNHGFNTPNNGSWTPEEVWLEK